MPDFQTIPAEEGALLQKPKASIRRVIVCAAALSFVLGAAAAAAIDGGKMEGCVQFPSAERSTKNGERGSAESEESTRSPMTSGGGARGPRRGSTEPRRDSCYYVQMRKRAHISVNGWQR